MVIQYNFYDAPQRGFHGEITDLMNPRVIQSRPAQEDVYAGFAVMKSKTVPSASLAGSYGFTAGYTQAHAGTLLTGPIAKTLADFQAVSNGNFAIGIDGQANQNITALDFGGARNFDDIASIINAKTSVLATYKASCTYETGYHRFLFTSLQPGAASAIAALADGGAGTDLEIDYLSGTAGTGAVIEDGGAFAAGDYLGISVRTTNMQGEPSNIQGSQPIYREGELLSYITKGSVWIKAADAITAYGAVYYLTSGTPGQIGSTAGTAIPNAYFESSASVGDIVKVVLE